MKVISMSKDRKRAQVVCVQHGKHVTRHAVLVAGTRDRYQLWNRPSWMRKDDSRVGMTFIRISSPDSVEIEQTV